MLTHIYDLMYGVQGSVYWARISTNLYSFIQKYLPWNYSNNTVPESVYTYNIMNEKSGP